MAVSTNHDLGGCVILLRLYLIDIVRKIIGGFQGYSPFQSKDNFFIPEDYDSGYTIFPYIALSNFPSLIGI